MGSNSVSMKLILAFVAALVNVVLIDGFVLVPEKRCVVVKPTKSTMEPTAEKMEESSSMKLTIPISGAATKAAFNAAASELAQSRPIPGWRAKDASKIPAGIVARAVGPELVKAKAIEALSETEVHAAIARLAIPAVGQARFIESPDQVASEFTPGSPFELRVCIDVWPEDVIWSESYQTPFTISVDRTESDQSVRAQAMVALCERYALKTIPESEEYQAQLGDAVTVDMIPFGTKKDEKNDSLVKTEPIQLQIGGQGLELVLEKGKFLPGVIEAILGLRMGDTIDVPVAFPDTMPREQSLAGKTIIFQIDLKKIELRRIPSPSELATSVLNTTLDALERQIDETVSAAQRQQGGTDDITDADDVNREIEKVLASRVSSTSLPEAMVNEACKQKFAVMLADMRSRGTSDADIQKMISSEGFEKYKKVTLPQVQDELRTKLAVEFIAKDQNIMIEQSEINDQLAQVKAQYKDSTIDDQKAIEKITDELTRIKVCDFLRENYATVNINTVPNPTKSSPQAQEEGASA